MRRLLTLVLALGLIAAMKTASFAAFNTMGISTMAASVSFVGQGVVNIEADLYNLSGGATTQIWWNTNSITVGATLWQSATSYVVLHSTITNSAGGIQIYTDNKGTGANPAYTGIGNPVGLISMSTTTKALPMCWRIVAVSTTSLTIVQGSDNKLYSSEEGGQAGSFPCFLWMIDKSSGAFANSEDYVTIKDAVRGIQFAEATWGAAGSPNYIYFGANFQYASIPDTYRTTTLRIEAFHD